MLLAGNEAARAVVRVVAICGSGSSLAAVSASTVAARSSASDVRQEAIRRYTRSPVDVLRLVAFAAVASPVAVVIAGPRCR